MNFPFPSTKNEYEKKQTGKALVAIVVSGYIEFEGLMLPNGDYAIAISQVAALDLIPPNRSLKQLKSLTGMAFQSHRKVLSELHPKGVNVISLPDFERLIFELALKGNAAAQEFCRQLIGLSLVQLFSYAFGKKLEKDEIQQFLKERQEGKFIRRTLTDVVKSYIESNPQLSDNDKKWIYPNTSDTLNRLLFGKSAKQLCELYQCNKEQLRNHFDRKDVVRIRRLEEHAMHLIETQDFHPVEAIKQAFKFWDGART
ncbi:MAG: hypothetical protein F6K54_16190 [Okeania sp. SIO3B5]|uniref:hypothetical protein n=1 Tax=Okeania sp. SIO3B5 TaxID=2607811 RepID=UPI0013FF3936|nr:hypothetical protein [Okeania sp. SIO3B5]NEO54484.1 hypothetical protein [Okeania sp. SIO3B5]